MGFGGRASPTAAQPPPIAQTKNAGLAALVRNIWRQSSLRPSSLIWPSMLRPGGDRRMTLRPPACDEWLTVPASASATLRAVPARDSPMSLSHWRLILNGKSAGDDAVREAVHLLRGRGLTVDVRVTWEAGDAARNTCCATTWFCSPRIRLAETSITAAGAAPAA